MSEIIVHSVDNAFCHKVYPCDMLSPILRPSSELKHRDDERSDDMILQGDFYTPPDMQNACYDSPLVVQESNPAPLFKTTGEFSSEVGKKQSSAVDRNDPEDSICNIISKNDFNRFVLFKRHYDKYQDISRKHKEAQGLVYYLDEKLHKIMAKRDNLIDNHHKLKIQSVTKDLKLHEIEEELFLEVEKTIHLEEVCKKLRKGKDKMVKWNNRLEQAINGAYRQLHIQTELSEITMCNLKSVCLEVSKQILEISTEKNNLEDENSRLKEVLEDVARKIDLYHTNIIQQSQKTKCVSGLECEVNELKLMVKQSTALCSQLEEGMKHFTTCRRKKCTVCSYIRATFEDYVTSNRHGEKTLKFLQTPERSVSRGLLSEFVSSDNLIIDVYSKPSNWPANCVGNGNVGGVNSHRQFSSDSSIISSATLTDPNMTIPTSYRSSSSSFNCCVRWTSLFSKLMRSVCTKQSANKS